MEGTCVLYLERGVVDRIWDEPWQTDTCIGDWHYHEEAQYKSLKIIIDMLVNIVSRNGNLLLNVPLPSRQNSQRRTDRRERSLNLAAGRKGTRCAPATE